MGRLLEHGNRGELAAEQIEPGPPDVIEGHALGGGQPRHVEQGLEQPLAPFQRSVEAPEISSACDWSSSFCAASSSPDVRALRTAPRALRSARELLALSAEFLGLRPYVVERGLETVPQRENQMDRHGASADVGDVAPKFAHSSSSDSTPGGSSQKSFSAWNTTKIAAMLQSATRSRVHTHDEERQRVGERKDDGVEHHQPDRAPREHECRGHHQ